jgi:serine/threonine protein kinase
MPLKIPSSVVAKCPLKSFQQNKKSWDTNQEPGRTPKDPALGRTRPAGDAMHVKRFAVSSAVCMPTLICPRCFAEIPVTPALSFCPRCGLNDVVKAASDTDPIEIKSNGKTYRVLDRLTVGSLTSVYRCSISSNRTGQTGIFKIARDARSNHSLVSEARILRQLASAAEMAAFTRFMPFLPRVVDSVTRGGSATESPRQANVLSYHHEINSPDELYTLEEVRAAYSGGLDARDVAWIWRRLLNVLSFAHGNGITHCAVLPEHVLIEPKDHKLVLIDWCFARSREAWSAAPDNAGIGAFRKWYERDYVARPASPALDISMAARCMVYLLDGTAETASSADPAIRRHFDRCIDLPGDPHPAAIELLAQFDQLIEALWGPRQFRPMTLPPK